MEFIPTNDRYKWSSIRLRTTGRSYSAIICAILRIEISTAAVDCRWQHETKRTIIAIRQVRVYMAFKPNMLLPADADGTCNCNLQIHSATATATRLRIRLIQHNGLQPDFDLWSTVALKRRRPVHAAPESVDQKLVAALLRDAMASDTDALQFREWLRTSLRSCAPRLRRGDWDFVLRLSRSRTRGISLHRIRAFGFAQD